MVEAHYAMITIFSQKTINNSAVSSKFASSYYEFYISLCTFICFQAYLPYISLTYWEYTFYVVNVFTKDMMFFLTSALETHLKAWTNDSISLFLTVAPKSLATLSEAYNCS